MYMPGFSRTASSPFIVRRSSALYCFSTFLFWFSLVSADGSSVIWIGKIAGFFRCKIGGQKATGRRAHAQQQSRRKTQPVAEASRGCPQGIAENGIARMKKNEPRIARISRMLFRRTILHPCHPCHPWFISSASSAEFARGPAIPRPAATPRGADPSRHLRAWSEASQRASFFPRGVALCRWRAG